MKLQCCVAAMLGRPHRARGAHRVFEMVPAFNACPTETTRESTGQTTLLIPVNLLVSEENKLLSFLKPQLWGGLTTSYRYQDNLWPRKPFGCIICLHSSLTPLATSKSWVHPLTPQLSTLDSLYTPIVAAHSAYWNITGKGRKAVLRLQINLAASICPNTCLGTCVHPV